MISKVVVGAGFGDEGKGTMTDYLAGEMKADVVIRFNGGAQTAHNVVRNGVHHTFSQWGSATLRGIPTFLGPKVLVDPEFALNEAQTLRRFVADPWKLLRISPGAVIVTPWHRRWSKALEDARGVYRHGSCGMGIGVAREMELADQPTLRVEHLSDAGETQKVLNEVWKSFALCDMKGLPSVETVYETVMRFRDSLQVDSPEWVRSPRFVVFEGAQGILLDEKWGTAPHNTWTDCTPKSALEMVPLSWRGDVEIVLVTRTYMTRHGYGPFPSEAAIVQPEMHNTWGLYQGDFRRGHLDFQALRYSLSVAKRASEDIRSPRRFNFALTHFDRIAGMSYVDYADSGLLPTDIYELQRLFEDKLGESIRYVSSGPTSAAKKKLW